MRFQAFRPSVKPEGHRREKGGGEGMGRGGRMGMGFEPATERSLQVAGRIRTIYQRPMISGFQTLHQARATVVELEPVTELSIHRATNSWDHYEAGFLLLEKREKAEYSRVWLLFWCMRKISFRLVLSLWL
ncbi:hypothetical protein PoB_001842400 [Plakobranchus ocellatus]|uniref:Uncharacterized protein n=1 Tax=Plakobranchus ocellatus TaxID=259542 RepID=A0AAV3Z9D0_9GAST|nr:hypothetical protein PoB_001842400 [Plakobranchus ocellatus]